MCSLLGAFDVYIDASNFAKNLEVYSDTSDERHDVVKLSASRVTYRQQTKGNINDLLSKAVQEAESEQFNNTKMLPHYSEEKMQPFVLLNNCSDSHNASYNQMSGRQNIGGVPKRTRAAKQQTQSPYSISDSMAMKQKSSTPGVLSTVTNSSMFTNSTFGTFNEEINDDFNQTETSFEPESEPEPVVVNIPSFTDLQNFLKQNNEQSILCSYIMAGVSAVVEDKLNSFRKEMKNSQEKVASEIEFLGNLTWGCENKMNKLQDALEIYALGQPAPKVVSVDLKEDSEMINFKFPLETVDSITAFEQTLNNIQLLKVYTEYFNSKLNLRGAKTLYSRRKSLKEILFSE